MPPDRFRLSIHSVVIHLFITFIVSADRMQLISIIFLVVIIIIHFNDFIQNKVVAATQNNITFYIRKQKNSKM